ncbi:UDP-N-acetylmuramate dehydrogenase [Cytobacillus firmus]|uniref:UDP-N-acetylenolpyruvoylglucosamine reductase n=2 Tax=Bacillaceae TaxID=186817 RepID=A0A380XM64_CYTFI|nr:UDP-N-acetylmuramate dehydrogenase [Cytobacillus firmus]KAF0824508.1 UDP-N-acetylenolpyruvoylglucosamine reductase [Cytobacillus firmus]MBG9544127.1 UDP-N-acetylenolpyruvoylglucosamine reductase [Cytobacillus firmus]MBG9550189.1 UDP-N-acetylenolpyruvoylglucosamine reductase [Cytobacillus firmus]MBG9550697.1 UDP-N-acetylenolpyruvoylglucosamine reductase [Cytobacillus firmus]MBG9556496.1 UDP-N-acetylenolpyruvoylglucosamine reductase [Cytobacillus firmus]
MDEFISKLRELNIGTVKENEPMANHTTMKIGGPADLFIEPSSIDSLAKAMDLIRQYKVNWRAIGRGSNLLVSDGGIEGVVIKLGRGMDQLDLNGTELRAGGGYSLVALSTIISKKGLSGLEFASGIPGSVGGAVYMNAGAHGSDISQILTKAHVLFEDGKMDWLTKDEMEFSYRTSVLQKKRPGIVLEAVFQLTEGDREKISSAMQKNKDYRKETQPWNFPCAGSIFRNPLPEYAGQLIEKAGLKGHSIGGAQISNMHGNFIVNAGDAKAEDVLALIQHIKDTIFDMYGVKMETEVEIIGRK